MPTLPTYTSSQQYRQVETPRFRKDFGGGLGAILDASIERDKLQEEFEIAEETNRVNRAVLNAKNELLLKADELAQDKTKTEDDAIDSYHETVAKWGDAEDGPKTLEGRNAFVEQIQNEGTKLYLGVKKARRESVFNDGRELTEQQLFDLRGDPDWQEKANDIVGWAEYVGFYSENEARKLRDDTVYDQTLHRADQSPNDALAMLEILKDPKFPMQDKGRKNTLTNAVKSSYNRQTLKMEADKLTKDETFDAKVTEIMESDASQTKKSRAVYDVAIAMGIGEQKQKSAQARLNYVASGITPSGSADAYNSLFLAIEDEKKKGSPENNDEAMASLKRFRELSEQVEGALESGVISYNPDYKALKKKLGKDLSKAQAMAFGYVKDYDDHFYIPFIADGYTYEDANKDITSVIDNTKHGEAIFKQYTRIVEEMEDTKELPPFVSKDNDKSDRRKDVRDYLLKEYNDTLRQAGLAVLNNVNQNKAPQPIEEYEVGKVYDTPKGPHKYLGEGEDGEGRWEEQ